MQCSSITSGYSIYECDNCGNYKYVPFTCKSRFCPSCGVNKSINTTKFISSKALDIPHRHITFTISDKLRIYFLKERKLLNLLFLASERTLISWFKQYKLTPGIIATLHTFGRDLKWNPHIHVLVTEGGYTTINTFKQISHFPFAMLRKRFMGILLNLMSSYITSNEFKKLKHQLYTEYPHGFYVYAKRQKKTNTIQAIKYITRYVNRPVIPNSRIISYTDSSVTFYYDRHEDDKRVYKTLSINDFIKSVIIHIPEKYFNMIRYYGIYSSKSKYKTNNKLKKYKTNYNFSWRNKLIYYFKIDPIACICGSKLTFKYFIYNNSP